MIKPKLKSTRNRVGDTAENCFRMWIEQVCGDVEQTERDRHGIDFTASLEVLLSSPRAIDTLNIKTQVKGTQRSKLKSWPITMSNWKKMITDPNPVFIVLFSFDFKMNVRHASILHITQHVIEEKAKTISRLEEKGLELNKHTGVARIQSVDKLNSAFELTKKLVTLMDAPNYVYSTQKSKAIERAFNPEQIATPTGVTPVSLPLSSKASTQSNTKNSNLIINKSFWNDNTLASKVTTLQKQIKISGGGVSTPLLGDATLKINNK